MTLALSARRYHILRYIERYTDTHGKAPTQAEIASEFDLDFSTVANHIRLLEKHGWIKRTKWQHRSIRIIRHPGRAA